MPEPVIIEVALNGGRTCAEHPGVPLTASELAAAARRGRDAGASVIHVHARGRQGAWTASVAEHQRVIGAIRAAALGARAEALGRRQATADETRRVMVDSSTLACHPEPAGSG